MSQELRSILTGTLGLDIALLAAILIGLSRPVASENAARMLPVALVATALQGAHFAEETMTEFYAAFPTQLGLTPWTRAFFVAFNATWLAIWLAAAFGLARAPRLASVALWFLALAALANGIAHPALALRTGGYFSGVATAPVLGLAGLWLTVRLSRASRAPPRR
ncbi:MAG: hypothetical protein U1E87_05945 [Alphaproteobacteria bacterium]